tara:strand:- start:2321 stop:2560 length:240 start_codon:yes stop_codon:yes gene_type:complete
MKELFTNIKIRKVVKKKKPMTTEEKRKTHKVGYQQGFSPEGAKLLARPWITPEPEPNFEDFTLASYIEGPDGYQWNDET